MTAELELVLVGVVIGWNLNYVVKKLKAVLTAKPCADKCCGTNEVQGEVIKGTGGGSASIVSVPVGGIPYNKFASLCGGNGGTTRLVSWEDRLVAQIASGYPGVNITLTSMRHEWRRLVTFRIETGTLSGGITMDIAKYWLDAMRFDDAAFVVAARDAIDKFLSRDTKTFE